MRVSFPEEGVAWIESEKPFVFNPIFHAKIEALEKDYDVSQTELSWFVLNAFVFALGSAMVAMCLVALCGVSVMSIAVSGLVVGTTAYMTYGLFRGFCQNDDLSKQMSSQPTSTF